MRRDECVDRGRIAAGAHRRASAREAAFYRRADRERRESIVNEMVNAAIGASITRSFFAD